MDDLEKLKVKVTNGAVTAIGMRGYTPVRLTLYRIVMPFGTSLLNHFFCLTNTTKMSKQINIVKRILFLFRFV